MQTHEIHKPSHLKTRRRVARGGKRGTFSGRGMKGQKSRAGARIRPQIWDYIAKIPKLRGMDRKPKASAFGSSVKSKTPLLTLNISDVAKVVAVGETVTPKLLVERGALKRVKGHLPRVKVLGGGELTKKIALSGVELSASAREKIEKAGGSIAE